jgi:hypothetical protein
MREAPNLPNTLPALYLSDSPLPESLEFWSSVGKLEGSATRVAQGITLRFRLPARLRVRPQRGRHKFDERSTPRRADQ